jgi:hypothetical protein
MRRPAGDAGEAGAESTTRKVTSRYVWPIHREDHGGNRGVLPPEAGTEAALAGVFQLRAHRAGARRARARWRTRRNDDAVGTGAVLRAAVSPAGVLDAQRAHRDVPANAQRIAGRGSAGSDACRSPRASTSGTSATDGRSSPTSSAPPIATSFAFAGLWDRSSTEDGSTVIESVTHITMPAPRRQPGLPDPQPGQPRTACRRSCAMRTRTRGCTERHEEALAVLRPYPDD